jgi:hypothetical protein
MKNIYYYLSICAVLSLLFTLTGCSSRTFSISCQPSDALILQGAYLSNPIFGGSVIGKTPVEQTITFFGKDDKYYFTATRRGFYQDTVIVTRDSTTTIKFNLNPIANADTTTFNPCLLKTAHFVLLPVKVDLVLHKGVGSLDSFERSDELSAEITNNLDNILKKEENTKNIFYPGASAGGGFSNWEKPASEINGYLLSLNGDMLNYYPVHPSIEPDKLSALEPFTLKTDSSAYLIYTYCKSIKPTAGRVAGNIAATLASGAVDGYNTAMYGYSGSVYNASAFSIDSSTLLVAFVLNPKDGKVLLRKDFVLNYHIAEEKSQKAFAEKLKSIMQE